MLDSIDDEEYIAILRPLLQQKRRSVKAHNDYELRQKLIKFAIGRGFTMDIIKQCISIDDEEEYDMELLLSAKTSSLACTCMHAHASLEK